jgi:hypothetical protein
LTDDLEVIHWSINFFFWIALALVLFSSIVSNRRIATVHANGKVDFATRWFGIWAWLYVVIRMCFIASSYLRHGMGQPLTFATGALLGFASVGSVFMLPGTVIVSNYGLEEVIWLWRNKRIRWEEIVEINTERKGSTVTVIGADKTKIIHSSQLSDRPRFLLEIKRHCGENLPADFPDGDTNNNSSV